MSEMLERVLARHLDPRTGSPYWLQRERELGLSLRARISCIADLDLLVDFDLELLHTRPISDFMPRDLAADGPLILGETGGTTGIPKTTAYTYDEFHAAFIQPFFACVDGPRVFNGGHWLWLGPGGPHIIGKAAQRIAHLSTGCDAFALDFDPRWYRRLAAGSLARARYLEHLREQALRIFAQQDIRYLFATPVVLQSLAADLTLGARDAIRFIYLGGMAIESEALQDLAALFPAAEFLAGYGNTLFGVCHEARAGRPQPGPRCYYSPGERLALRIAAAPHSSDQVDYCERGQVVMYRFDLSCLLPGIYERDHAEPIAALAPTGCDGLCDPRPPAATTLHIDNGIY